MMEERIAIEYLTSPEGKRPSEIGEAVDALYEEYGSYKAMSDHLNVSPKFLNSRHRIFQLPRGIKWKIDQGQIGITQGYELSRIEDEDDQWLLALAIIEENLKPDECKRVVNIVLKRNSSIRDALRVAAGVQFDKIEPLLLPLGFDFRLAISRVAWNQCKNWEDFCFQLIRQGIDVDIRKVAIELEALASELQKAGRN